VKDRPGGPQVDPSKEEIVEATNAAVFGLSVEERQIDSSGRAAPPPGGISLYRDRIGASLPAIPLGARH
jgi:hypothetical protein